MSAFALRACVTLRLQARQGEWVPLRDLQAHLGCNSAAMTERLRHVCEQLVDAGHAHHARREGVDFYGIGTEGAEPPTPAVTPQERTA